MQWFKNLNTVAKLMLGFAIVLVITGVVGYQGIQKLAVLDERVETIFDKDLMGISDIKDSTISLQGASRAVRNLILATGDTQAMASLVTAFLFAKGALTGLHATLAAWSVLRSTTSLMTRTVAGGLASATALVTS